MYYICDICMLTEKTRAMLSAQNTNSRPKLEILENWKSAKHGRKVDEIKTEIKFLERNFFL